MYTCLSIHTLPNGGFSKAVLWGRLKKIHVNYTTVKACSGDATASKAPYPVSMSILVFIYYFYFTWGALSKEILVLVITTVMCRACCNTMEQGTTDLTS